MPQLDFNKLVVLHIYNYIKPKGEQDPLSHVERECHAVKLSTCMRVIYILNTESLTTEKQIATYKALTDYIDRKDQYSGSIKFERFDGDKAYKFLLYWIIGGVNPKRPFDDTRIIGDVRSIWTKIQASTIPRSKNLVEMYSSFFHALLTDSGSLGRLIPLYEQLDLLKLTEILSNACSNCTWARVNGFLAFLSGFNYNNFAENTHLASLESSLQLMQERISKKVELSPTGTVHRFFGSENNSATERIAGISTRLETITSLLQLLNSLKEATSAVVILNKDEQQVSSTLSDFGENEDANLEVVSSTCGDVHSEHQEITSELLTSCLTI